MDETEIITKNFMRFHETEINTFLHRVEASELSDIKIELCEKKQQSLIYIALQKIW